MFSGLFSRNKKAYKTILLVDIGSGSVGAGLARLNAEGKPTLLFTLREDLPVGLTRSGEELQAGVIKAATSAIESARKSAALWSEGNTLVPQKIEHVAFFLAAPWSTTSLKAIHFSRSKPFKMSLSVLERMLTEEDKTSSEPDSPLVQLVEKTLISLRLNEYPSERLGESFVNTVDATLATTHSFSILCDALLDIVHHMPTNPEVTFHSFALPVTYALQTIKPDVRDALIVDVGAEVTEILHLKRGVLVGRATAPVGTNLFLRTLKTHADIGKAEADTALLLAKNEGTRLSDELAKPLTEAGALLLKGLSKALTQFSSSSLPYDFYVFADSRVESWIVDAIDTIGFPEVYAGTTPKAHTLTVAELSTILDSKATLQDPFIMAELIFADSRFDEGHSLSLLSTQEPLLAKRHATLEETQASLVS